MPNLVALVSSLIFSVMAGLLFELTFEDYEAAIGVTDGDAYAADTASEKSTAAKTARGIGTRIPTFAARSRSARTSLRRL